MNNMNLNFSNLPLSEKLEYINYKSINDMNQLSVNYNDIWNNSIWNINYSNSNSNNSSSATASAKSISNNSNSNLSLNSLDNYNYNSYQNASSNSNNNHHTTTTNATTSNNNIAALTNTNVNLLADSTILSPPISRPPSVPVQPSFTLSPFSPISSSTIIPSPSNNIILSPSSNSDNRSVDSSSVSPTANKNKGTSNSSSTNISALASKTNVLYKTELCQQYVSSNGNCPYGTKCQFAHGLSELNVRTVDRGANYKTKPCVNWVKFGECKYGARCCFIH